MKLFLFLIFLSGNVLAQKKNSNGVLKEIRYEMFSQSGEYSLSFTKSDVRWTCHEYILSSEEKDTTIELSIKMENGLWNKIVSLFSALNQKEISKALPPTNSRDNDGAAYTKLYFTSKNKNLETPYFDHGSPNNKLRPLIALLFSQNDIRNIPFFKKYPAIRIN